MVILLNEFRVIFYAITSRMAQNSLSDLSYTDPRCTLFADAPVCIQEREEVYGALKQETVTLRCRVDANPPVAAFHWTFNNSGDQTDVPSEKYTNEVSICLPAFQSRVFKKFVTVIAL